MPEQCRSRYAGRPVFPPRRWCSPPPSLPCSPSSPVLWRCGLCKNGSRRSIILPHNNLFAKKARNFPCFFFFPDRFPDISPLPGATIQAEPGTPAVSEPVRRGAAHVGHAGPLASGGADRSQPHQPRREFAPGPLAELAESIRRHGIIQPLSVRRRDDGWELIAGERRLRAAKLAGLQTVPCLEMQVDKQDSAILALIENIQRRDLHYLEEATAIAAYLRRQSGSTQEEAAALLGRSPSALANKLRLLRLSLTAAACSQNMT